LDVGEGRLSTIVMFSWSGEGVKVSTDETIYFQTLVQFLLPLILVEEVRKRN
jgi:hypothetical protein